MMMMGMRAVQTFLLLISYFRFFRDVHTHTCNDVTKLSADADTCLFLLSRWRYSDSTGILWFFFIMLTCVSQYQWRELFTIFFKKKYTYYIDYMSSNNGNPAHHTIQFKCFSFLFYFFQPFFFILHFFSSFPRHPFHSTEFIANLFVDFFP